MSGERGRHGPTPGGMASENQAGERTLLFVGGCGGKDVEPSQSGGINKGVSRRVILMVLFFSKVKEKGGGKSGRAGCRKRRLSGQQEKNWLFEVPRNARKTRL